MATHWLTVQLKELQLTGPDTLFDTTHGRGIAFAEHSGFTSGDPSPTGSLALTERGFLFGKDGVMTNGIEYYSFESPTLATTLEPASATYYYTLSASDQQLNRTSGFTNACATSRPGIYYVHACVWGSTLASGPVTWFLDDSSSAFSSQTADIFHPNGGLSISGIYFKTTTSSTTFRLGATNHAGAFSGSGSAASGTVGLTFVAIRLGSIDPNPISAARSTAISARPSAP